MTRFRVPGEQTDCLHKRPHHMQCDAGTAVREYQVMSLFQIGFRLGRQTV